MRGTSAPCGVSVGCSVAFLLLFAGPTRADPISALNPNPDTVSQAASQADPADEPSAQPSCVAGVIDAIQRRYESVEQLSADFVQTTRSAALPGSGAPVSGHVTFAKPGKMHWQYRDPDSSVISDGRTLWIFDPAFGEAQKLPVGEEYLSGASIQFLLGNGEMRRDFEIVGLECNPRSADLQLMPRKPSSYERLQVRADVATGDLVRTTIFDLLGNVTEVAFSNVETDFVPDPELFVFRPPEGVRVIELDPGTG